tara:strand:+ start:1647 stop:2369 length:723 start_codon:yes stop_codon:yes gene_type:complete
MAELERPTVQLADASGPHPLADESNYEFLQKLFDAKEKDPLAKAGYDVDAVFQILEGKKGYRTYGVNTSDLAKQSDTNLNRIERNLLYKSDYEDLDRLNPKMSKANKGVIMMEPWNTEQGVITLIHELRHKAIDDNPVLQKIVDDSGFAEEYIIRSMDLKYFDDERTKKFMEKMYDFTLTDYGQRKLNKVISDLEEASVPKKEEKEEPSFFSKIKTKLGFKHGGPVYKKMTNNYVEKAIR